MTVYIIIPVHNRKALTQDCLVSLQGQDEADIEIVVVDDGSKDGTSEMVQNTFPEITLLHGDGNLWWVGSINKGIEHALNICQDDDYILVLNDDLVVQRNYVSSLLKAAKLHPKAMIGSVETLMNAPKIIKNGGNTINWATAKQKVLNKGRNLDEFSEGHIVPVSKLTGRGTLFPSEVFRVAGLYDNEHFQQCGDTELPVRADFRFGYSQFVSYDAVVISVVETKENINNKKYYTLSDFRAYFFDLRSNFNFKYRYGFARCVAPNSVWFLRYLSLDLIRIVGHFIIRLRLREVD